MKTFDVIVLGAGAAGLMCALTAGQRGKRVLVIERANKSGKKILMSGGGRCNFTNLHSAPENFISRNPQFCISALSRYTQHDFIEMVDRHGIAWHEKSRGQLFCDESSRLILDMLLLECRDAGVKIKTSCEVRSVEKAGCFLLESNSGIYKTETLVIATGGLSIPRMGGSGFGYTLARQFALNILPTRAGLVPFTITGELKAGLEKLAGISLPVVINTARSVFQDDMLFTHRGLSGPAVLQSSSYWHDTETVWIDTLPHHATDTLLLELKTKRPNAILRTVLSDYLPRKLVALLEKLFWQQHANRMLAEWSNQSLLAIAGKISHWPITPSGTEGYRTAEVTLGGIDTGELSSRTMESRQHSGLFFIGEVVDVTGHLGGYNFQWAWSSGNAAGLAV